MSADNDRKRQLATSFVAFSNRLYTKTYDLHDYELKSPGGARREIASPVPMSGVLRNIRLGEFDLNDAMLRTMQFADVVFQDIDFSDCEFDFCLFVNCTFVSCRLRRAEFTGALFANCTFERCQLLASNWFGSNIQSIEFKCCEMSDTSVFESRVSKLSEQDTIPRGRPGRFDDVCFADSKSLETVRRMGFIDQGDSKEMRAFLDSR